MALTVKSYVLTAASGSYADIFNALIAHFTSAPAFWQLKSGATNNVAGQAFLITQKTSPTHDLNFRVTNTTTIATITDPGRTITNCGSTASAPTGASSSSHTERAVTEATASAKGVYVIELQSACYILLFNAAYTLGTRILGGAKGVAIPDSIYNTYGIDGSISFNGIPTTSGVLNSIASVAGATNVSTAGVLVKCGSTSAMWWGLNGSLGSSLSLTTVAPANPGVTNDILLNPISVVGYDSSLGWRQVGFYEHIFLYPIRAGVSQTQLPRTLSTSATEEWLFINNAASASNLVIAWEKGVAASKPV